MCLVIIKGTVFLSIIGSGLVGNIFVFVNSMWIFFWGSEKKSARLILIHLAFANAIILLSKVTLKTMATFGLRNFPDDLGCKMFVFLERVARGLSISTTSFLTVVQAATISPGASVPASLKPTSPWHLLPFFLFFWTLNSLVGTNLLNYIVNISSLNSSQLSQGNGYCYFLPVKPTVRWAFLTLMALRDLLFLSLMGCASVYMVFLLHKHHKHVLSLRKSKILYQTPPEIRATHSVLLLMLCFIFFYGLIVLFLYI